MSHLQPSNDIATSMRYAGGYSEADAYRRLHPTQLASFISGGDASTPVVSQEDVFRRMADLDSKLQYLERREQEQSNRVTALLEKVEQDCTSSSAVVANLEMKWSKDLMRLESHLSESVEAATKGRVEGERQLRQLIEDESVAVRRLMSTQEQMRVAEAQKWLLDATHQLEELKKSTEASLQQFRNHWEGAVASIARDAARVEDSLATYQRQREASEMQLLKLFEETCVQLHQEIVQERTERIESHRRLERLVVESLRMS